jgi:molybdopterin synthase sulfur carrier subunit
MKITVRTTFELKPVLGARSVDVDLPDGSTLRDLLRRLNEVLDGKLSTHLFQAGTDLLLPYINIMVNGQSTLFLAGMETLLKEDDEVLLLPLVSGG